MAGFVDWKRPAFVLCMGRRHHDRASQAGLRWGGKRDTSYGSLIFIIFFILFLRMYISKNKRWKKKIMASRQASSDEILLRYRTVTVKGGMKSAFSQTRRRGRGREAASSASIAPSSFDLQGNCLVTLVQKKKKKCFWPFYGSFWKVKLLLLLWVFWCRITDEILKVVIVGQILFWFYYTL